MEDKLKEIGIDCPVCKTFIQTPLEQVLFGDQFVCKSCSSEFLLDKNSMDQVLKQLQEMNFVF